MAKRAARNREFNQLELRKKIAAGNHHHQILDTLAKLSEIDDEIRKKKFLDRGEQAKYMTRIGALRTKMDGQFRLLSKYLPDLSSVKFEDDSGGNPFEAAARAWATALKAGTDDD